MNAPEPPAPVLVGSPAEVAAGVYVIPDGGVPLVPNVGVVLGDRSALVIDSGMGPGNGTRVLEHASALADGRRLLLTSTHFHPEHAYGAQVFALAATSIVNRAQRDEQAAKGEAYLEMFRGFGASVARELEGVVLVEPDVVFDGDADLDLGGRRVELRPTGRAHTRGDQVVFLPAERILFTGDLVETAAFPIFPFFPPDDVVVSGERWIGALERLAALEPAIVVPGHGAVGGAELISELLDELVEVRDASARLAAAGLADDEVVAEVEPAVRDARPAWVGGEWVAFAIRCFLAERRAPEAM
jgi:glyoxylase-like metal-dependent hydrolase (beta-lactamase superfamily II)